MWERPSSLAALWQPETLYGGTKTMDEKQFKKMMADVKKMTKEQREEARAALLAIDPNGGVAAPKVPASGPKAH